MTLQQEYTDAQNPAFLQPVIMATLGAAIAIVNEDPATPQHTARVALARLVIQSPTTYGARFAFACTSQGLTLGAADAAIQAEVAAVWNSFI